MSHRALAEPTAVYRFGRFVSGSFLVAWNRMRVEGREHVPPAGGVLIVGNHQSFLDIPAVAWAAKRHVAFVARESLARSRFMAWLMRESGAVLVRRGAADRGALRAMVERLETGAYVAVFPEGTRSRDGSLGEFRGGALFVARRAGVPIVPVGIRGAVHALPRDARFPRPRRIGVRFGPPVDPEAEDALERVRGSIAGMIGDGGFASVAKAP